MNHVLAFLGIAALVIVTPGQDTALTIRNVLRGGRRSGVYTAFGVALGQAVWALAASAGITALLVASQSAFAAVRIAGAAYLVFIGAQALVSAYRRDTSTKHEQGDRPAQHAAPRVALRQGFLSNLGNPKMAVFFTSLLPQFVPAGHATFVALLPLGLIFCILTLLWLTGYACVVARAGDFLRRPRIRRTLDAITGAVLVGFGLRLAAERQ